MKILGEFVLEASALACLCLVVAIGLGVPPVWALTGVVISLDLGLILFLGRRPQGPDKPRGLEILRLRVQ
jgi:hypothetical protein